MGVVSFKTAALAVVLFAVVSVSGRRLPQKSSFDVTQLQKLLGDKANLKFGTGRKHPIVDHHHRSRKEPQISSSSDRSLYRANRLKPFNQKPSLFTTRQDGGTDPNAGGGDPDVADPEEIDTETINQIYGFDDSATEDDNDLPEGHVCFSKLMLVEEVQYTDVMTCNHVTEPSCFETWKTVMRKVMDEECKTNFVKECNIRPRKVAKTEKYTVCHENYERNCDGDIEGPTVCTKEYDTICTSTHKEREVEETRPECVTAEEEICMEMDGEEVCRMYPKQECTMVEGTSTVYTPDTRCELVESQVCGPENCPLVKTEPVCEDKVEEIVIDTSEETCHLIPRKTCSDKVKMVPGLVKESVCKDVSREVCSTSKLNPQQVRKPVVRKWCGDQAQMEELMALERAKK